MDVEVAQLEVLRLLLNYTIIRFLFMNIALKTQLVEKVKWVFEKNQLTTNLVPDYKSVLQDRLYGPKNNLLNFRMAEFHSCEMKYRMILDKVPNSIEELIAVLYRAPIIGYNKIKDEQGDIREPYNGNTVAYRAKMIQKWPEHVKNAILMFYDGCRQHIIDNHPEVFTKQEENSTPTNEEQFQGMFMMMRGIATDGKYGNFGEVENMYIYTALNELTLMIKENKEMEQQLKSSSTY